MEAVAKLNKQKGSPRKMRLVADLIRGLDVNEALGILKFTRKHAARPLEKLLVSAIANWRVKHSDRDLEESQLYVKAVTVDGGTMLKRFQPAPYGRAHRIRKRSNHVTIVVSSRAAEQEAQVALASETVEVAETSDNNQDS